MGLLASFLCSILLLVPLILLSATIADGQCDTHRLSSLSKDYWAVDESYSDVTLAFRIPASCSTRACSLSLHSESLRIESVPPILLLTLHINIKKCHSVRITTDTSQSAPWIRNLSKFDLALERMRTLDDTPGSRFLIIKEYILFTIYKFGDDE